MLNLFLERKEVDYVILSKYNIKLVNNPLQILNLINKTFFTDVYQVNKSTFKNNLEISKEGI